MTCRWVTHQHKWSLKTLACSGQVIYGLGGKKLPQLMPSSVLGTEAVDVQMFLSFFSESAYLSESDISASSQVYSSPGLNSAPQSQSSLVQHYYPRSTLRGMTHGARGLTHSSLRSPGASRGTFLLFPFLTHVLLNFSAFYFFWDLMQLVVFAIDLVSCTWEGFFPPLPFSCVVQLVMKCIEWMYVLQEEEQQQEEASVQ